MSESEPSVPAEVGSPSAAGSSGTDVSGKPRSRMIRERWGSKGWKRTAIILAICLVVETGLFTIPVFPVTQTEIDDHGSTSTNRILFLTPDAFTPSPTRCVQGSTNLCSNAWIALNWSTQRGQDMMFALYSDALPREPPIYNSTNSSYGGYTLACNAVPGVCEDGSSVVTNDTSGFSWSMEWRVVYSYSARVPVL